MKKLSKIIAATTMASAWVAVGAHADEKSQKLSGSQIRAKFAGMQVTDEVHFRDVYVRRWHAQKLFGWNGKSRKMDRQEG